MPIDANAAFDNKERLHKAAQDERKALDDMIVEEMARIDLRLNNLMEEMNSTMYHYYGGCSKRINITATSYSILIQSKMKTLRHLTV